MSEPLHLDNHPDADQLSAFAERTLPEHERVATLAHLADCADCREIVFLAQQTTELESPAPEAIPVREPWFNRWNLLSPAAAALACVLITVAVVHHVRPTPMLRQAQSVQPRIPQRLPQAISSQPAIVSKAPPTTKPQAPAHLPIPRKSANAAVAPQSVSPITGGSLFQDRSQKDLPLQGRSVQSLVPLYDQSAAHGRSSLHGALAGAVSQQALVAPQQTSSATDNLGALNQTQDTRTTVPSQNFNQQVAAVPPPSPAAGPQSTNQTVDVSSAAPSIQTENSTLNARVLGAAAALPTVVSSPLPSKLPTKVRISNGHETLAVDAAGALYRSQDAGIHWQQIKQQWSGKVSAIVLIPDSPANQPETNKGASGAMRSETSLSSVSRAKSIKKPGFELTTDIGATWTSSDGFAWLRK
jgi:hypothetical protein